MILSNGTCFQNIWFNKKTHPNEYRNGHRLSTKWLLASDQSSVRSWLVQPIKELSSAAGRCAGRGCALIRQLANAECAGSLTRSSATAKSTARPSCLVAYFMIFLGRQSVDGQSTTFT